MYIVYLMGMMWWCSDWAASKVPLNPILVKKESYDVEHLVSELGLQFCTIVEIGQGFCSVIHCFRENNKFNVVDP